jgi:hypothetical protein
MKKKKKVLTAILLLFALLACRYPEVPQQPIPPERAAAIIAHADPSGDAFVGDGNTNYTVSGEAVRIATNSSGQIVGYYIERPTPHSATNYEIVPVNDPPVAMKGRR